MALPFYGRLPADFRVYREIQEGMRLQARACEGVHHPKRQGLLETQRFLAQRMGARVRLVPGADHTPIVTAPEAVVGIIAEAIAQIDQG